MKIFNNLLLGLAFSLALTPLTAQEIIPLSGYDFLANTDKETTPVFPKMDCDVSLPDVLTVTAGDSINISIDIDTVGFPAGSSYNCLNCETLGFGNLITTPSGFRYFASASVDQGLDTLSLAFCNQAGDSCTVATEVVVLVQRAPRVFTFGLQTLMAQERTEVVVPEDELPGGAICRQFVECDENYEGRDQEAIFLFAIDVSNDFRYTAGRLAGVDQVCIELCNEFGLCDQYIYAFRIDRELVDLPFFDDFSRTDLRPDARLWQNEDVLINRTFAINPPSLGVATFDAVGPRGEAYADSGGSFIPRDYLTSAGINMASANDATLTFYAQPRGLANRPEINDSLVLQFLDFEGNWQTIWSLAGLSTGESNCSDRPFIGYRIPIPASYNYNGFQFRFFNRSSQVGSLDHWHLDYVKLDDQFTELNLDDIALIEEPLNVTTPYTSLPYRQFVGGGEALIRPEVEIGVWNHASPDPFLPAPQSNYQITEQNTIVELLPTVFFSSLDAIPAAEPFINQEDLTSLTGGLYANYRDGILGLGNTGDEQYRVRTTYNLNSATATFTETSAPGLSLFVQANNRAIKETVFADYYAHDDGSAELALAALPGQILVQEFEAFIPEVLRGISIRLPRAGAGNPANESILLTVFIGELDDDEPDFAMEVSPIYVEDFYQDSLGGFTSYAFPDSIDIPIGKFYVGWQQVAPCVNCVPVGIDRNNNVAGLRFFNNGGGWFPFDGCSTGAFMVRPLVGDSQVPITNTTDPIMHGEEIVRIYPNPAQSLVNLQRLDGGLANNLNWELYNLNGQSLGKGSGATISVTAFPKGLYLLRYHDTQTGQNGRLKLIVD